MRDTSTRKEKRIIMIMIIILMAIKWTTEGGNKYNIVQI